MTAGHDETQDRLAAIAAVADSIGRYLALDSTDAALRAVVVTARLAFGAAACSIAAVDGGELAYRVADGAGADSIVGTRLPLDRGLAGFAIASGQVLAIDDVQADRRFADDVANATGYVPTTMLVAPIDDGDVLGVLSVLDREPRTNALDVAAAFASQAAHVLAVERDLATLGRSLLTALAATATDGDVVSTLLEASTGGSRPDLDLDSIVALAGSLSALREAGPAAQATAVRLLADFADYVHRGRRR